LIWLITFASCSLVGLPLLLVEGWSMGELRAMANSAARETEIQLETDAQRDAAAGQERIALQGMTKTDSKTKFEERPR
jgi:hypothetical protein